MVKTKKNFIENAQQLSGLNYRSLDMGVARRNIIEKISTKANLVLNDYQREITNELGDFIVVTDVLLIGYDLEIIASNITDWAKQMFGLIFFITPEYKYVYDGYEFKRAIRE